MGHCVVFLGKAFSQCLSLSTQEYKWVKEESRKPNEMLGGNLAMDWHPIPSASVCHYCTFLFQFFIKNEGNQMDTVSGKPNELLGGGGVTLQWIGIPSPVLQFATNVPFCSSSSLKMKETKWTQCQESLMKCWGVQTSSTHLLF